MKSLRQVLQLAVALVMASAAPAALAQDERWPSKPVKLIVTFPPGGVSDLIARLIAPRYTAVFGQQFIVDNRPGADGMIGSEVVARAAPDGYTLLISNSGPQGIAPAMHRKIRYDALKDFVHIAHIGAIPHVLLVNPSFPSRTLQEFIGRAKAQPDKIDLGTGGPINQLAGELFRTEAGIQITNVPYKGTAQAVQEVRGRMIPSAIAPLTGHVEMIRSGELRALAITSAKRSPLAPEIPTFAELGYPKMIVENWVGISGPAKLGDNTVQRIAAETRKILEAPDVRTKISDWGVTVDFKAPAEFARYVEAEIGKWRPVVISSGVQVD